MDNQLAPIVLFVYNRPTHTVRTLEALANNELANKSKLYIYSDGAKNDASEETKQKIAVVREAIRKQQWCKEVEIVESVENKGLAPSVIAGVGEILNKHGKVIVLEDDLVTSKYFLKYMNEGLVKYEQDAKIMQLSGYSFPIKNRKPENKSFLLPLTTTWGWGTWQRVWKNIDFECEDYHLLKTDKKLAKKFDLDGAYNYKKMFIRQMENKKGISSWGIRYYWSVFKQNGLVLYPDYSLVKNIGWDGSGHHKDNHELFPLSKWDNEYSIKEYPQKIEIDFNKFDEIKKYIRKKTSIFNKIRLKANAFISK